MHSPSYLHCEHVQIWIWEPWERFRSTGIAKSLQIQLSRNISCLTCQNCLSCSWIQRLWRTTKDRKSPTRLHCLSLHVCTYCELTRCSNMRRRLWLIITALFLLSLSIKANATDIYINSATGLDTTTNIQNYLATFWLLQIQTMSDMIICHVERRLADGLPSGRTSCK